jgi:hypothetical protein
MIKKALIQCIESDHLCFSTLPLSNGLSPVWVMFDASMED